MTDLPRLLWVWGVLSTLGGCSGEPVAPLETPPKHRDTGPTASEQGEPLLSASCELEEGHALRAWCEVSVTPPQPLVVTASHATRGDLLYTTSSPEAATHRVPLLWLPGDSPISWSIQAGAVLEEGSLETQPLPVGVKFNAYTTGNTTTEGLLFPSPCLNSAYAILTDSEGEVRWYQQLTTDSDHALVESLQWTDRGTVLALLDHAGVVEVTLEGETVQRLYEFDPDREWHHDATVKNDYTYVLFKETRLNTSDAPYLVDGVHVLNSEGTLLATWTLADHVALPLGDSTDPGPLDWSHANSIWVSETGETALISLRHLSTILAFRADPEDPSFGQIEWSLTGNGGHGFSRPLSLESDFPEVTDFQEQHHAHLDSSGKLVLFDNRAALEEDSRVLVMTLEPDSGTARVEARHTLPVHCPYQGAAYVTEEGVMATCAPHATAYEVHDTSPPLWSMEAECAGLATIFVPRFIPVSLTK